MAIYLKQLDEVTTSDIDAEDRTISNVTGPTTGDQAANKTYVDSVAGVQVGRLSMSGAIKSIEIGTATDTIDLIGLDFDADGEYEILVNAKTGDSGTTFYYIYAGDPTLDETNANYDTKRDVNAGGSSADAPQFTSIAGLGDAFHVEMHVTQDANGRFRVSVQGGRDTSPDLYIKAIRSVNTFGSITRLRLKASQANGFAVGTTVKVYRKGGTVSNGTSITPLDVKRATDGIDDEFDEPTLDSQWTIVGGSSSGVVDINETAEVAKYDLFTRRGWLLSQVKSTANANIFSARLDKSLADGECFIVKCSPGYHTSGSGDDVQACGIVLNDSDTSYTSGNYTVLSLVEPDSATGLTVETSGNVGATVGNHGVTFSGEQVYMKATRDGNDYDLAISVDGTSWHQLDTTTSGVELTNLWLWHRCTNAATKAPIVAWDFVRLGDGTALDPWPLVDGSSVQPVVTGEWRGALVSKTSDQTSLASATWHSASWETEDEDTDGISDIGGSNPERLTVQAGVSRVILRGMIVCSNSGDEIFTRMTKNGSIIAGLPYTDRETTGTEFVATLVSHTLSVVEGDYFELQGRSNSSNLNIIGSSGNKTWFAMEIVEPKVALVDRKTVSIASADSPYTVLDSVETVLVDADGDITLNAYSVVGKTGRKLTVKVVQGASTITIDPDGSETIEGASTVTLSGVGEARTYVAVGGGGDAGWHETARSSAGPNGLVGFTCTATEAVNDLVYISAADTVAQADASAAGTSDAIGWIFAKPTTTTCLVSFGAGPVTSSSLTAGDRVYLSDTAGAASASEGTVIVEVGFAKSTTEFVFLGAKQSV